KEIRRKEEAVKPLPKAPPRSSTTNMRRIRKSAILTDTPEKNALAEEKARRGKSNRKIKGKEIQKRVGKKKATENATRKVLQEDDHGSDSEEDSLEWYCLICCDSYSNSQPVEQWIECVMCKNWSHLKCLKSKDVYYYVCPNCNSDDEIFK
ncbi:PHD finger protein ALFIN-LIKE 5-like, partial [Pieris napi]|uniref:PHD finger protein ALFIN-LIKE 5-like n=1 Tax=Pieris napi TaxID=78633 RepID=UPI001FBA90A3